MKNPRDVVCVVQVGGLLLLVYIGNTQTRLYNNNNNNNNNESAWCRFHLIHRMFTGTVKCLCGYVL